MSKWEETERRIATHEKGDVTLRCVAGGEDGRWADDVASCIHVLYLSMQVAVYSAPGGSEMYVCILVLRPAERVEVLFGTCQKSR
jgi:hypothetical protein